jgi:hypothetical protein
MFQLSRIHPASAVHAELPEGSTGASGWVVVKDMVLAGSMTSEQFRGPTNILRSTNYQDFAHLAIMGIAIFAQIFGHPFVTSRIITNTSRKRVLFA